MIARFRKLYDTLEENPFLLRGKRAPTTGRRMAGILGWAGAGFAYVVVFSFWLMLRLDPTETWAPSLALLCNLGLLFGNFTSLALPGLLATTLAEEVERDTATLLCLTPYPRRRMMAQLAWCRFRPIALPLLGLLPLALAGPLLFLADLSPTVWGLPAGERAGPVHFLLAAFLLPLFGFLGYLFLSSLCFFGAACGLFASARTRSTTTAVALAYALYVFTPCLVGSGSGALLCVGCSLFGSVGDALGRGGLVLGGLLSAVLFLLFHLALYVVLPLLLLARVAHELDRILVRD
ncbi:MAG: hypothetical protein HYZ53_22130 [Planctomycetes bacterium]|nr:hypothetical protein [Planctomycetota bacterium]